jgi:methionyl-tRNA formyltransferase
MVTSAPLRVVFFGTPQFAVPSLEALLLSRRIQVAGVITQPDRPRGRGHHTTDSPVKRVARSNGLPILQPERLKDDQFLDTLSSWRADLGVVAAYGRILPEQVLASARLGLINVHASLLPRYRGAAPVHRAVMAGERTTGVTIMRVVRALDAGPMLSRQERAIGPEETSESVEHDLSRLGAGLLIRTIGEIAAGTAREVPQNEADSTYAPRLTKADGLIDWARSSQAIHDQVRGLHPWPHAFTFLDGERLIIHRTSPPRDTSAGQPPGTILVAEGDDLMVATGEGGALRVMELQAEGGRLLRVREFLAGHRIRPWRQLTSAAR